MVELPAIGSLPLFLAVVRSSDHSMSLWCPCRNAPAVGIHKPVARRKGTSAANVCSPPIRQRQIANDATMVFYPTFSSFPGDSLLQLFGFFPHQVKLQPAPRALAVLHDQTRRFLELDRLDLGPGWAASPTRTSSVRVLGFRDLRPSAQHLFLLRFRQLKSFGCCIIISSTDPRKLVEKCFHSFRDVLFAIRATIFLEPCRGVNLATCRAT